MAKTCAGILLQVGKYSPTINQTEPEVKGGKFRYILKFVYSFEFKLELICTIEYFKKPKLKNLQVQVNSKLNATNRVITY